ncbi:uncharacterized protein EV420DRAFT_1538449 [Desarmillaria tabescens]|uniref:F-box domain-containing protein n=1 Tax=Armillaria tabescens TaxID=1929756 RepID=A0AA39KE40_ARMTA|nr:uncharacterized protein EV420DRAFT_1538449 [Desarmillaria tabescens]KAK0459128.1 hypothetical protein EV420DRAFT_1538449 [Desarmillaria tabescens]
MMEAKDLPFDILPPILDQLADRHDLCSCAIVSKMFNRAATPLLYETLDSQIISSKGLLRHPSMTLNQRPELAQYVCHITETGAVHCGHLPGYPNITRDALIAVSRCSNLQSMTWIDDSSTANSVLFAFMNAIHNLPVRELTIRTLSDFGEEVWQTLKQRAGLRKLSLWCMDGPPRVLEDWSNILGDTLTHLELGRCAGVPPTILITVLSDLPLLKDLRLKGAQSQSIPMVTTYLPSLETLDTEYLHSNGRMQVDRPIPVIKNLTVRSHSMDNMGPNNLWPWMLNLVPKPGLESLKLHAFTVNMGNMSIPRVFILDLASVHSQTLKHFIVEDLQMTLTDVECLCVKFPELQTLVCMVASSDITSIAAAIEPAINLRTLRLQMPWLLTEGFIDRHGLFNAYQAKDMMLRYERSVLRVIELGSTLYTGKWILRHGQLVFEVFENVSEDKWRT